MTGEERAWGWVQHLREGGTVPWSQWSTPGPVTGAALPGAQQLELLRRLNERHGVALPGGLVARILATSAPGRGQPDLELVDVATPSDFGPRPVDPGTLPPRELLRVTAALLAQDLVTAGVPAPASPRRLRLPLRPGRARYRLVGDPRLADPLREQLVAQGRPPGGRAPRILVLAAPVDRMLVDAWTWRCFDRGAPSWTTWLRQVTRQSNLPARVDPLAQARRWSERVGRDRVEIVLDPTRLGDLLGVRRPLTVPAAVAPQVPDLARRVAALLTLHVDHATRGALLRQVLAPRLAGVDGAALALPPEHHAWVARHAERLSAGLARAGYAVHGDLADLRPRDLTGDRAGVTSPDPAATLDLAMRLMLEEVR